MMFDHFIVTRFAISNPNSPDPKWLDTRKKYVEHIFLPSIKSQTCQNFKVILLVDHGVDLSSYEGMFDDQFEIVRVQRWWKEIRGIVQERATAHRIITTRLDSDDAISFDFVERVQKEFKNQRNSTVVDLVNGLCFREGKVGPKKYPSNMFVSMVTMSGQCDHCYSVDHSKMTKKFATIRVDDVGPFWVHTSHPNAITWRDPERVRYTENILPLERFNANFFI